MYKMTRWAGRKQYDELFKGGVRIYEFAPDDDAREDDRGGRHVVGIGTMNFDNRSLVVQQRINLNVLDPASGAQMDSVFLNDLK